MFSFRGPRYPVCGGDEQEINVAGLSFFDLFSDNSDST